MKGSGDNSSRNSISLSAKTVEVPSGYSHAMSLPGGLSDDHQKELKAIIKKYRIPYHAECSLIKEKYGIQYLRYIESTQFYAVKALFEKEGKRLEPLWTKHDELLKDPEWEISEKTESDKDRKNRISSRLQAHLGLEGELYKQSAMKKYKHNADRDVLAADEIWAKHHGAKLTAELKVEEIKEPFQPSKNSKYTFDNLDDFKEKIIEKLESLKSRPQLFDLDEPEEAYNVEIIDYFIEKVPGYSFYDLRTKHIGIAIESEWLNNTVLNLKWKAYYKRLNS